MRLIPVGLALLALLPAGCGGGSGSPVQISGALPASVERGKEYPPISLRIEPEASRKPRFQGEVTLKVEAPAGLRVTPAELKVQVPESGPGQATLTIAPAADAPTGKQKIKVTAT